MKKNYSIILRSVLMAVMVWSTASCINNDDLDACVDPRGNVRLTVELETEMGSRNTATLRHQVDSALVYVFDDEYHYTASCQGGAYTPGEPYEFFLNLEDGDYHFVVWTNPGDYYQTNRTLEDCQLRKLLLQDLEYYLSCPEEGCLREDIPDLLYGIYHQATVVADQNNHFKVQMIPNTYLINIKVKGLPESDDVFGFSITDNNSHYSFENSIIAEQSDFQHIRTCTSVNEELNTSIKVLRLEDDRSPRFRFTNDTQNDVLFDKCLVQTIHNAYQAAGQIVDFTTTYTFDIVLTYDTEMGVSVSVNGWDYTEQPEEL